MKLSGFRRLFRGDFSSEFHKLIDGIGITFNNAIESLFIALNGNLSLQDNIKCTIKDVTVRVNSSGVPVTDLTVTLGDSTKVLGVTVLSVLNDTNPNSYPVSGVFISFSQSGSNINIKHITGLQANTDYTIKLVAWN